MAGYLKTQTNQRACSLQTNFYALDSDLSDVLELVSKNCGFGIVDINETRSEGFVTQKIGDQVDLSIASTGSQATGRRYLLVKPGATPIGRKVILRKGGHKFILDQKAWPASVYLKPGGSWASENAVVAGEVSTCSEDEWSKELYRKISQQMRCDFTKVKSYLVGAVAISELRASKKRFTHNSNAPSEYDLRAD